MRTLQDFRLRTVVGAVILQVRLPASPQRPNGKRRWADARPEDVTMLLEAWCERHKYILRCNRKNRLMLARIKGCVVTDLWTEEDLDSVPFEAGVSLAAKPTERRKPDTDIIGVTWNV